MKIALTINGTQIDSNLPGGVPTGGINTLGTDIIFPLIEFIILALIFFAMWQIITSGYSIIFSKGEKERFQKAISKLKFAVMGLVAIFAAFLIINFFQQLLGGISLMPW